MYRINLTASNLKSNERWNFVAFNSSSNDKVGFSYFNVSSSAYMTIYLPNGSYSIYYGPQKTLIFNSSSFINITGYGFDKTVYLLKTFLVNIKAHGLRAGEQWSLFALGSVLNNSAEHVEYINSTFTDSMNAYLPDGNYTYGIYLGLFGVETFYFGFSAYFNVYNKAMTVNVTFPASTKVVINESGLPVGTPWTVYFIPNGSNYYSINSITSINSSVELYVFYNNYRIQASWKDTIYVLFSDKNISGNNVTIHFSLFKTVFDVTNLPHHVSWALAARSKSTNFEVNSDLSTAIAYLPNGTYNYSSLNIGNTKVILSDKNFTVDGVQKENYLQFMDIFKLYLNEINLPKSLPWSVKLYGINVSASYSNRTVNNSALAYLPYGQYRYVASWSGNYRNYLSGVITFSSPNTSLILNFPKLYPVRLLEKGLPQNFYWCVQLRGMNYSHFFQTTSTYVILFLPTGNFSAFIEWKESRGFYNYTKFAVYDSNETVVLLHVYNVTFTASNLPKNVQWTLTLAYHDTFHPIDFSRSNETLYLTNGTFNYSVFIYSTTLPGHKFGVTGSSMTVNIQLPTFYIVRINEINLFKSLYWSMKITSRETSYNNLTNRSSILAHLPDGTYNYSTYFTTSDYEYREPGPRGTFTVDGFKINITVHFPSLYKTIIDTQNLHSGVTWHIQISNGTTTVYYNSTSEHSIVAYLPAGNYTYRYYSSPSFGRSLKGIFSVTKNSTIKLTFPDLYKVNLRIKGLPLNSSISCISIEQNGTSYPFNVYGDLFSIYLTNGTYNYCFNIEYENYHEGVFSVFGHDVNKTILTVYNVHIDAVGLPSGNEWSISLTNKTSSFSENLYSQNIETYLPNGTYTLNASSSGYNIISGFVTINGQNKTIRVNFSVVTSKVTFVESGLSVNTYWQVTVNNITEKSNTSIIVFSLPNGEYTYSVSSVSGYTSSPTSGSFSLDSKNASFSITFSRISVSISYNVVFTESGLHSGTAWSVTLNGKTLSSTSSTITFTEPNGTYSYTIGAISGYSVSPSSGSITVTGKSFNQAVTFAPTTKSISKYTVTFTETGLPSGTTWYLNLSNGQKFSSTTDVISFSETNGTYSYTIATSNKIYNPYPYSGSFTVKGAPASESITFSKVLYKVTFSESGLPSGTEWYVNGTGISGHATSPANITFNLANGTYSFTITNLSEYYTTTVHFSIAINGRNMTETVDYYHWVYITGKVSPTNATVTINGKAISLTSSGSFNVSVASGTYHVVASSLGYTSYYNNFTLNSGRSMNLTINLKPISKPSGISSAELFAIIGVVAAIIVIIGVIFVIRRR
jgi:hypothetical protein